MKLLAAVFVALIAVASAGYIGGYGGGYGSGYYGGGGGYGSGYSGWSSPAWRRSGWNDAGYVSYPKVVKVIKLGHGGWSGGGYGSGYGSGWNNGYVSNSGWW